ncbi:MAG: DUF2335 domain-containing protein [Candidatus Tisiphia sp.]|jgi:uncharacterized membrane protein|uniref:DUF2335 domain-containing protein n=1 Tax=Candidatus Tisiphia endosymbiont of Melanophora roralis TaxID=3066261 RepID=UPI003977D0A8
MKDSKSFFANNNRLNKGYLKVSNPKESDNSFYSKKFAHVLPPVDLMAEYENIYPGTLIKLIAMAEKEQVHRHQMDIKSIEVYESVTKKGRISSIIFMIMVCITTVVLAVLGHFMIASIFTVSVLLGIGTGVFLSSAKFTKRKDYTRR